MDAKDLYHFGLVADDYEGLQAQLTDLLGYRWGDEIHLTMPLTFPENETTRAHGRVLLLHRGRAPTRDHPLSCGDTVGADDRGLAPLRLLVRRRARRWSAARTTGLRDGDVRARTRRHADVGVLAPSCRYEDRDRHPRLGTRPVLHRREEPVRLSAASGRPARSSCADPVGSVQWVASQSATTPSTRVRRRNRGWRRRRAAPG